MSTRVNPIFLLACSRTVGIVAAVVAVAVLLGWIFSWQWILGIGPGLATMKVNTAVAIFFSGVAVWFYASRPREYKPWFHPGVILIAVPLLIGTLTLLEYLFAVNFGIDELLIADNSDPLNANPGRPAIGTALNLVLLGGALLLLDRFPLVSRLLTYALLVICILVLIGYAFGLEALFDVRIFTAMALHTAAVFTLLGSAVLACRPEKGITEIFLQDSAGGAAARRLILLLPALITGLGVLRATGQFLGLYSAMFGIVLMLILSLAVMAVLIFWTVRTLHLMDSERAFAMMGLERERRKLEESEQEFRNMIEAWPVPKIVVNGGGQITLVNVATENLFGYSREEMLGQPVEMLIPTRVQRNHEALRKQYSKAPTARQMGPDRELWARKKSGEEFPVEVGLAPVTTQEGELILSSVRDLSERKQAEELIRKAHDRLEQEVKDRTRSLHEANEQLQAASEELMQSNRDLEQFAYVASHDLQEPLRAIAGCTDLLAVKYRGNLDADADELISHILSGTERMRNLIQGLLAFSRLQAQTQPKVDVDVTNVVRSVVDSLRAQLDETEAQVHFENLPVVRSDPAQLEMVFQNLISNGLKFRSSEPPRIEISASEREHDWLICVADNGIGIDPKHSERIFQIFQRLHTRSEYPGTGIGLALTKRIVERHGGEIHVVPRAGGGSEFRFTLAKHQDG